MNKTKVNLKNNIILKSENIEYENDTLKNYLDTENILSLLETVIGKYKDKTKYAKIIEMNGLSASEIKSVPFNIENYENIWIADAFLENSARVLTLPEVGYNGELNSKTDVWVEKTTNTVNFYSNGGWGDEWKFTVILNYTKKS